MGSQLAPSIHGIDGRAPGIGGIVPVSEVRNRPRMSTKPSPEARAEDDALLSMLRQGAPEAVGLLLKKYQGRIFSLANSILKSEGDAEEAVQDVFLAVVRKVGTFKGDSALYSWIYRICVNTCLMRLRGRRRSETVPLEEFLPVFTTEGVHARPVDDWSRDVERRLLNKELGELIRRYTDELPDLYRVVFLLSDVEGMTSKETAHVLGLTVPAVKTRLHRARLCLRERLSRYLRDGGAERTSPLPGRRASG